MTTTIKVNPDLYAQGQLKNEGGEPVRLYAVTYQLPPPKPKTLLVLAEDEDGAVSQIASEIGLPTHAIATHKGVTVERKTVYMRGWGVEKF